MVDFCNLCEKLLGFSRKATAMQIDVEYSRYKNKDYVTVKDNPLGLLTRMHFTKAVFLSAVFTTMAATAVMCREKRRSTREDGQ